MNRARTALLLALAAIVSLNLSCSRTPQETGPSAPAGSPNTDANAASPKPTSDAAETKDQQRTNGDPSTGGFVGRDIDLNSGDFRGVRPTLDDARKYLIYESELSREVRRLGIPIPEERRWKVVGRMSTGGMDVYYEYGSIPSAIHALTTAMDDAGATDEERRDVLYRFMTTLRADRGMAATAQALLLRDEVLDRHGLKDKWAPGPKAAPTTVGVPGQRNSSNQTPKDAQP